MAKYVKTEQGYKEPTEIVDSRFDSKMNKNNPVGTGSFSMGRMSGSVIGSHSHAEGRDTTASGAFSHAEGDSTTASGQSSHAEGGATSASSYYSHAEGNSTTASGYDSHAEGKSTTASGNNSHAEGSSTNKFSSIVTKANPTNADIITAWGSKKFSVAKGTSSHVEGEDNLALANYSHAEGASNIASGYESHAEGFYTTASGNYSHAEGSGTTASIDYSHAEGSGTTASGYDSHAEGFRTTALGYDSHAEGYSTNTFSSVVTKSNPTNDDIITAWKSKKFSVAKGTSSHVEGQDSLALGEYAHAEGSNTTASGSSSHAEGSFTKASKDYQHAQGKYNIEDSTGTYADIIGNGTSDTARSNAATVDWSGNAWYAGDVYVGSTSGTNKDAGSKKLATEEYVSTALEDAKSYADGKDTTIADALEAKVGTVTEGKTVVEMIADAQAAATYDDTALSGRVTTLEGEVTTLVGSDTNKSARTIASEEVAKIVAGADTAYDTLKEIADWIASHKTDAAAMNSAITALEEIVDGIGGDGEKATVVEYVTDAIAAIKIGDYAKAADLTTLATRVTTAEGKITTLESEAHTHTNKALLDSYTQTEANLADAVAKKHEHSNKTVLDGITSEKVSNWDKASEKTNDESIPSYWTTALETGAQEINTALCNAGRNKSAFLFYSDAHWSNEMTYTSKMAPKLLKYLYKHTPINQTNFGGDIVSAEGTDNETMSYLWDWREQVRDLPNHHSVIGNHDDGNTTDRLFTKEYIYAYLLAPEETNDIVSGGDFYYYIDNLCEKTRYLYLDTMYDGVSDTQLAWASEAIKGVSDGWHIVAISHAWYANDYSVYPPILNGFDTNAKKFLDMFDNYNARSGEYGECLGFVDLCIGGHYHLDHYENTDGGIPVIIVEADTFHDRSGTMPTHGNTTESAVSAVVVDRSNKVVKVIRIGRGSSFEVPINVITATYTNVISISVGSDGKPFNNGVGWCANSRIGSGGIYMGNQSGDAAQWVTGHIAINPTISNTFRLKNITFNKESTNSNHGIAFFDSSFARVTMDGTFNWRSPAGLGAYSPVYDSDGNITEFTFATGDITNTNVAYIAICAGYIGDDSIITINEPIE